MVFFECLRILEYSLHEQSDPHVDGDELADGNVVDVSTRPETTVEVTCSRRL